MAATWDAYFAGPVPPEGGVNWEAYTHEELYQMLWQNADVADVSMVARDWAEHRAALDTHAEVLREQRAALLESWEGAAAEEAANRLGVLADRMEKISELAGAGQRAAQDAADALAMARAMMPPPPSSAGAPLGGETSQLARPAVSGGAHQVPASTFPDLAAGPDFPGTGFGGGSGQLPGLATRPELLASDDGFGQSPGLATAPELSAFGGGAPASPDLAASPELSTFSSGTPTFIGVTPAPEIPEMAPNPAMGGGSSFYFGDVMADQQKAQAVRAMQTYESSLVGGSQLIGEARGAIPAAAQTMAAGVAQGMATVSAAVPWERLVGGGGSATHMGVGGGPGMAGPGASVGASPGMPPLGPGGQAGAMPGTATPPLMPAAKFADSMAARAAGHSGMVPPVGGGRPVGADSEEHENRMPFLDHGLFAPGKPQSAEVIGLSAGGDSSE